VFGLSFYETTTWAHKNECMHSPCNTILSLHEPIHSFPLHLHVHLALEEEPLEVQDLGLELSLQKNLEKIISMFNISMMKVLSFPNDESIACQNPFNNNEPKEDDE
jgi:hypothetical protein